MSRAVVAILLLAALLLGCGEENVLQEDRFFTGLWKTEPIGGQSLILELQQNGDALGGNLYVEQTTGDRGAPDPILEGITAGDRITFTVDYAGLLDTLIYRGTRTTDNTMEMEQYSCFPFQRDSVTVVDTCVTFHFLAHRAPSGF